MNKFAEYHFSKYNRDGSVKFKDILRIVHPKAKTAEQGAIFAKIMSETLETAYTWETELSANGQRSGAEKLSNKQIWTNLVQSRKVGYMALVRNLRNIISANLDDEVYRECVLSVISDPKMVERSRMLPSDFITAYNVVQPLCSRAAKAISMAVDASVANMPNFGNKIWQVLDFSGSMDGGWGATTGDRPIDIATFMAAAVIKRSADSHSQVTTTFFGSSARTEVVQATGSVLEIRDRLLSYRRGGIAGSTNFRAALAERPNVKFEPDTVLVFSDGEVDGFPYHMIANLKVPADAVKCAYNLSIASTTPMSKNDGWHAVSGWSSNSLKWIAAMRSKATVIDSLNQPYVGLAALTTN